MTIYILTECSSHVMYAFQGASTLYSCLNVKDSTIWPNGWVFVYELSGSGFESSCSKIYILPMYIYNYNNLSSSTIWWCLSCNMCFSLGIPIGTSINVLYLWADSADLFASSQVPYQAVLSCNSLSLSTSWDPTKSPVTSTVF